MSGQIHLITIASAKRSKIGTFCLLIILNAAVTFALCSPSKICLVLCNDFAYFQPQFPRNVFKKHPTDPSLCPSCVHATLGTCKFINGGDVKASMKMSSPDILLVSMCNTKCSLYQSKVDQYSSDVYSYSLYLYILFLIMILVTFFKNIYLNFTNNRMPNIFLLIILILIIVILSCLHLKINL